MAQVMQQPAKLTELEQNIAVLDQVTAEKLKKLREDVNRLLGTLHPPDVSFAAEELEVLEKALLYLSRANWLNPTPRAHARGQETVTLTRYERMKSIVDKIRLLVKK